MNGKKVKISEFINSMEGEELNSSTCLLGGATGGETVSPLSTSNGTDCVNTTKDACNKSTNNGACKNVAGFCNSSKNAGACNNGYLPDIIVGPGKNFTTSC